MTKAQFCNAMVRLRACYDRGCEHYFKLAEMGINVEDSPFDELFCEALAIMEHILNDRKGRISDYVFERNWGVLDFDEGYDVLYEVICDDNKEDDNV